MEQFSFSFKVFSLWVVLWIGFLLCFVFCLFVFPEIPKTIQSENKSLINLSKSHQALILVDAYLSTILICHQAIESSRSRSFVDQTILIIFVISRIFSLKLLLSSIRIWTVQIPQVLASDFFTVTYIYTYPINMKNQNIVTRLITQVNNLQELQQSL